jgi:hypothetical protein
MNRHAVVLAADSATTVTHGYSSDQEVRYFKGANKIFQLSDHHPVGMMVFDSADLLKVPWELIVKAFRRQLAEKAFNSLQEYAEEFFDYLRNNFQLFPQDVRQKALISAARTVALAALIVAKESASDGPGRVAAGDAYIARRQLELDGTEFPQGLSQEALDEALGTLTNQLFDDLPLLAAGASLPVPSDQPALMRMALTEVYKEPGSHLGSTGLVFAGYGDHDTFPSMIHYQCGGLALSHLICAEVERTIVDHDTPAGINAFAQTSMTDTFVLGVSYDVYSSLSIALRDGFGDFVTALSAAAGVDLATVPNLNDIIADAASAVRKTWLDEARREHNIPMRRVLAVLPIDELAELAETLIKLQSLKEKVTKPSETVGGPVDVAVITRNEGLVWIRRKHYFDAEINPRYMKRLGS